MSSLRRGIVCAALVAGVLLAHGEPQATGAIPYGPGGTVGVVAGGGNGDGGAATSAVLNQPYAAAPAADGSVYIADAEHCRIRRVAGGVITNVAGTGLCSYGGDGGPASSGWLSHPHGVAVSASGDVYIGDTANCSLRKVSAGTISTILGDGSCQSGNGPDQPEFLAVDGAGALYFSTSLGSGCTVWKIAGATTTLVAGTGACSSSGDGGAATSATVHPSGIAVDADGNVYIAELQPNYQCYVRKVTAATGIISRIAGTGLCASAGDGGPALSAAVRPWGIAADATGRVYIADACALRKIEAGVITTVASCTDMGPGIPYVPNFSPFEVAVAADGRLFGIERTHCRVSVVASGAISPYAGNGDCSVGPETGPALAATLFGPAGVATDGAGALYVADQRNCRVRRVVNGQATRIGGYGQNPPPCPAPVDGVSATASGMYPSGVAVDGQGAVYIADAGGCRIRKIAGGVISTIAGNGSCFGGTQDNVPATSTGLGFNAGLGGLAVGADGSVYVSDGCRVVRVTQGVLHAFAGGSGCGSAGDGGPALSASLDVPVGLAVAANGDLFVAESGGCRVRKVSGGIISTAAGDGTCGYGGDGGPATSAELNRPYGVAADALGTLYIADTSNCAVRRVSNGVITTMAGGDCAGGVFRASFGIAVDRSGNVYVSDAAAGIVRVIYAADTDGDGYTDVRETSLGANPALYCAVMRADVSGDGIVTASDLGLVAVRFGPADANVRENQDGDGAVSAADLGTVATKFGAAVGGCAV